MLCCWVPVFSCPSFFPCLSPQTVTDWAGPGAHRIWSKDDSGCEAEGVSWNWSWYVALLQECLPSFFCWHLWDTGTNAWWRRQSKFTGSLCLICLSAAVINPTRLTANLMSFCPSSHSLQCTKKVIEASRPRFRNLTNPLYTPIIALKYADETGGLSVHAFYHMLFHLGPLMHVSLTAMKYLTCGCLRSRTVSPN